MRSDEPPSRPLLLVRPHLPCLGKPALFTAAFYSGHPVAPSSLMRTLASARLSPASWISRYYHCCCHQELSWNGLEIGACIYHGRSKPGTRFDLIYSHGPEMVRTRHAGDMSPCLTSATFVLQRRKGRLGPQRYQELALETACTYLWHANSFYLSAGAVIKLHLHKVACIGSALRHCCKAFPSITVVCHREQQSSLRGGRRAKAHLLRNLPGALRQSCCQVSLHHPLGLRQSTGDGEPGGGSALNLNHWVHSASESRTLLLYV